MSKRILVSERRYQHSYVILCDYLSRSLVSRRCLPGRVPVCLRGRILVTSRRVEPGGRGACRVGKPWLLGLPLEQGFVDSSCLSTRPESTRAIYGFRLVHRESRHRMLKCGLGLANTLSAPPVCVWRTCYIDVHCSLKSQPAHDVPPFDAFGLLSFTRQPCQGTDP